MLNISLIIPCFQRVEQTIRTIDLIFSSNGLGKDFGLELIVSDSSPDEDLMNAVRKKYADKVAYTKPSPPGIAANKNQGARIAKNNIIIFCDSDIEVEADTIKNTLASLKKNKKAAAIGGKVLWKGGPEDGKNDRPRPEDRRQTLNGVTYVEALYSRYMATYKSIFFDVGGYDEDVFNMRGEGSDLSVRYWSAGYPLVYDSSIITHHVEEVEGGIIRGVEHPEWGIAKDFLLLAYKYGLTDSDKNFVKTVKSNFGKFGDEGYFLTIEGIIRNLDFIVEKKPFLDAWKKNFKPKYKFKFLEIFSDEKMFEDCIKKAPDRYVSFK